MTTPVDVIQNMSEQLDEESTPPQGRADDPTAKRKTVGSDEVRQRTDELDAFSPEKEEGMVGTPFTERLQHGELPATFKHVTYEYTGTTDPWEHLSRFITSASLHRLTDGVKCRVFATTLAGPAQRWFSLLPRCSVHSFAQFSEVFLNHFASSKKQKSSTLTLFAVRQKENEPLRSYVQRFNTATLEVPATSEEVLINALAQGLRMGEFFDSLSKKAPVSFNDLLRRAEKYINAEESRRSRTVESTQPAERRKDRAREEIRKQEPTHRRELGTDRRVGPRFENYG